MINNKKTLLLVLVLYVSANAFILNNQCSIVEINNCELFSMTGLSSVYVLLCMVIVGMYFYRLAYLSIKSGIYPPNDSLIFNTTAQYAGRQLYMHCVIFIAVGSLLFVVPIVWWKYIINTVTEYKKLYP
jgi:uncharacterized membrane protein